MENAYKNFQDESVGARLSTEFKRHNWLQKKLAKKMDAGRYEVPDDLDPAQMIDAQSLGQVFLVTNKRFVVMPEKPKSAEDVIAQGPITATTLVSHQGGKGPSKHRSFHVTLPDGSFTLREVNNIGPMRKQAEAFEEAYRAAGGR